MNHIDVTLRDGGHQVSFDWNDEFLTQYLPLVSKVEEVGYVELGYWSQTAKSSNRFYNMKHHDLELLVQLGLQKPASIMIDYHYCEKNLSAYKSDVFNKNVGLVRLCSRREDIKESVQFGKRLTQELGVELSMNFFNITNYSQEEIEYCIENAKEAGAKYLYFADTHGALDLNKDGDVYGKYADMIRESGVIPGLHLHDHSGKAYLNYCIGKKLGFGSFDFSLGGMGKGVGNLKMEHVIDPIENLELMDLLNESDILKMPPLIPGLITAKLSATDYYAVQALEIGVKPSDLAKALRKRNSSERDIFDSVILKEYK
jgi:4-hydroxy 2-oxovalerate aldolase